MEDNVTDRLTDDEIKALRLNMDVFGVAAINIEKAAGSRVVDPADIGRLLDEIEERRSAERSVATVIDEAAEPMTAEQWSKFQALMPKRKDGGA